jgi:hypothetical protein
VTTTLALPVCSTPHPHIEGTPNVGEISITERSGNGCIVVGKGETIVVKCTGVPAQSRLWLLVYSPVARLYYPHNCAVDLKPDDGQNCQVYFEAQEPYEVIAVLADQPASTALEALKGVGIPDEELPIGIRK